ncbi:putative ATP-dependent RNA helicase DDX27 [Trichinella pseudospiralis]|uniref:RNA helicase n=1 Tax=Trichinella pseudospiralis TaxID=6337 RepID=A0A0V1IBU5_TRIPS|nr:putative ATP-dependent RNA helicase DDX27 [Trichinella pseudospiralis]
MNNHSKKKPNATLFNPDFVFNVTSDTVFDEKLSFLKTLAKQGTSVDLNSRILETRQKFDEKLRQCDALTRDNVELSDSGNELSSEDEKVEDNSDLIREKLRKGKPAKEKEDSFFDNRSKYNISLTFEEMNLSRSLNKAISSMNYINPTPIQSVCIPVALLGKDICACAATGTGKTCAYMIPILERLLFKPVGGRITRVLVMVPTRELAMQVYETGTALAKYTSISIALSTGGMDLKSQEAALRLNPDVVIATPGRLIDHLHNSPSFNLNGVEILVLDEADRMLDEYFEEQMLEIMRLCSPTRQAMLFSATMTDKVKDLASVSLKKPVKLFVNENTEMALNLRQQFVRIRKERECSREAILAALLKRSFTSKVLLFARTKEVCHRLRLLLGLLGIRVAELHGNLSQAQRIDALEQFKKGVVDVLVATDVAARGIDVPGVKTVINYQMPHVFKLYVHRVGRTARAGRSGCAVSLVSEDDRKLVKEIAKHCPTSIKRRILNKDAVEGCQRMIDELLPEIDRIVEEEKQERQLSIAEKQIAQAKAKLENDQAGTKSSAGNNDSQRAWFQTPVAQKLEKVKNKQLYKEALRKSSDIKQKFADVKTRKKQLSHEQESGGRFEKLIDYQVRAAKRKRRQARLRACVDNAPKMAAKNGNVDQGNASFTSRRSAWNIPFADDDSSEWPAFATEQALTNCVSSHQ